MEGDGSLIVALENPQDRRVESLLSENAWDQKHLEFWVLESLHVHDKMSWEWNPSVHPTSIYASYMPYTCVLR